MRDVHTAKLEEPVSVHKKTGPLPVHYFGNFTLAIACLFEGFVFLPVFSCRRAVPILDSQRLVLDEGAAKEHIFRFLMPFRFPSFAVQIIHSWYDRPVRLHVCYQLAVKTLIEHGMAVTFQDIVKLCKLRALVNRLTLAYGCLVVDYLDVFT